MGIPVYPVHLEDPLLQGFYDGLAAGELRITADAETGEWIWYPPEVVPGKPDAVLEWRAVSPEGRAYTYTTIVRSLLPGDHKAEVPFTCVLFEPDDAPGVRVPGILIEDEGVAPACGMRLRFKPVEAGDHWIAGFVPID
ncbi:Zn-ribbon domain-containing OB-fold protein [Flavisphingomonas formosensis]|uniref:Zn-ribbon domain-containing OB-fold protein n=1 Tax=Flavisphingomonas formosensis TaxID=861534 RepID=UPI0012F75DA5|nr:DNA-binding protein [Sphingomonas formosensis]